MGTFKSRPGSLENLNRANARLLALLNAPAEHFAADHRGVEDWIRRNIPPLEPIDLVGLLQLDAYSRRYEQLVSTTPGDEGQLIGTLDSIPWEMVALLHAMLCHEELALKAGLISKIELSDREAVLYAYRRLYQWQKDTLFPACLSALDEGRVLDAAVREDRLVSLAGGMMVRGRNPEALARAVEWAEGDLGHRTSDDPPLSQAELRFFMRQIINVEQVGGDVVYRGRDGSIHFGKRQLRDLLEKVLGRQSRRPPREQRHMVGLPEIEPEDHRSVGPVDLAAFLELRDLLAARPFGATLARLIEATSEDVILSEATRSQIRPLLDLLDKRDGPALKGAILYEWAKRNFGKIEGGRSGLAQECGVTAREIEWRAGDANRELERLFPTGT